MTSHTTPDGRTFTEIGTEPYIRKSDGLPTTLRVWRAPCAHPQCTAHIVVKTTLGADPTKCVNFRNKHCERHKVTVKEFRQRGREALKRMNAEMTRRSQQVCRKLSDQDIADIRASATGFKSASEAANALALIFPATAGTIREIISGRRRTTQQTPATRAT